MNSDRAMAAACELLEEILQEKDATHFLIAQKGREKFGEKAVICVTRNPIFASILQMLRDGFEELPNSNQKDARKQLISKLRDKLTASLTMLQCEEIGKE